IVICPSCGTQATIPNHLAGKRVTCPECQGVIPPPSEGSSTSRSPLFFVVGVALGVVMLVGLAVLILGLGAGGLHRANYNSPRSQSANNLKQMGLAVANLAGPFFGKIPPGFGTFPSTSGTQRTWFYHILPFIEQDHLYKVLQPNLTNYSSTM